MNYYSDERYDESLECAIPEDAFWYEDDSMGQVERLALLAAADAALSSEERESLLEVYEAAL